MYNYKVWEAKDLKQEIDCKFASNSSDVTQEYKSGKMDPCRETTKYESLMQKRKKLNMARTHKNMFKSI